MSDIVNLHLNMTSKREIEEINRLAKEISHDLTEPSSMEKILIYYEELHNRDEEFLKLLQKKVKSLDIYWDHPWYHNIETCGFSNPPSKKLNPNWGEPYRKDKFTHDEHEIIARNWAQFMKEYDVPDQLVSLTRWRSGRKSEYTIYRRFLVAYLGRGLKRSLEDIFKHIEQTFAVNRKNIKYTESEEIIIETCLIHSPKKACPVLKVVLGRDPRSLYKRFTDRFEGKKKKFKIKWDLPLATKLVKSLMNATDLPLEQLKYKKFDKSIWLQVEKDMGQSYYTSIRQFWYCYLHVQLFVKYDVRINRLRKKILRHLQSSPYKVWSDIRWKDVLKEFNVGFTHIFLYRVCATAIKNFKNYYYTPLQELIDYSFKRIKNSRFKNKRLKTLAYNENGELEVVHYERKYR